MRLCKASSLEIDDSVPSLSSSSVLPPLCGSSSVLTCCLDEGAEQLALSYTMPAGTAILSSNNAAEPAYKITGQRSISASVRMCALLMQLMRVCARSFSDGNRMDRNMKKIGLTVISTEIQRGRKVPDCVQ